MYRKKAWRILGLLMVALLVLLIAGGCGGKSATQNNAPSQEKKEGTAATSGKYPEKPITIIVPYAAGGSTDALARAIEKVWTKYSPQPVMIVNKPGAGGVEGREFVKTSKPDGYTLMIGYGSGEDLIGPQLQKVPYDPLKDFTPIARMSIHSTIICVPGNSQFKSMQELINWAKTSKQPVTASVSTATGNVNITMRGIGKVTGINIVPIPHQGGAQAITDLIGGHTIVGGGSGNEVAPHIQAGRLRPLAVDLPERDPAFPDVPTLKEQGINFYSWGSVKGIAAPAGTPKEVVDYLAGVLKKVSEDPEFKESMKNLYQPILYMGPEEYQKFFKEAYDYFGKLIKDLNITLQ
ncbi:tripartite tricarboxylate transporter substrate binding protein [Neomoorella humiferrea]|uniref:Tripartite tricarboxylate transporter family receptor n=1 Tax=Neomoorella humiferrea TaxID=676965 RepID=A0A2T0AWA3_9FIRM|nr:tripartite tricarboxylate transporter substrate binding protein [Moorella humiferrea]PRR75010.1 Tripartite tricarboxylate transporter family receptor [Moorella humiferrea]